MRIRKFYGALPIKHFNFSRSRKFVLISFLILSAGISASTPAKAGYFGNFYSAPVLSFGGGNYQGLNDCPVDQVMVGVTFNQNPMVWGYKCAPLNSDLTLSPLSTTLRNTAGYVFCPDGMAAVGMRMISSGGLRLGLSCKTPPLVNDAEVLTQFVATQASPSKLTRTTENFSYNGICNAGDLLVGAHIWANLWFDQIQPRCAPFTTNTLTYNVNSGSGVAPASISPSVLNATVATSTTYTGTRSGFTFSGWNTAANGTGTTYPAGSSISVMNPVTLFAQWNSTITYDGNGNTGGTEPLATVAKSSAAVTELATNSGVLTRTGYTFTGWNSAADGTGTSFAAGLTTYSSTGSRTLYAQWQSTITYSGNGNSSGTAPASTTTTRLNASVTLATNSGTLARTGYTFSGWNSAADGSGTTYAVGATNYQSLGSTTLYAQWNSTITFNANNANSGAVPTAMVRTGTAATPITGNVNSLARVGYRFVGWNTSADGSGTKIAGGANYASAGSTTLYAEWELDASPLNPDFKTDLATRIGIATSGNTTINSAYSGLTNDLIVSDYPDFVQIIASVPVGTLQIVTTTNLTLPIGYQSALGTAASEISFVGKVVDVNAALATLKYIGTATAGTTEASITVAYVGDGSYRYNPTTSSYYWRSPATQNWDTTYNATTANSNCGVAFNGLCGYMTTFSDLAENTYAFNKLGTGWIGLTDSAVNGVYRFVPNAPRGGEITTFLNWNTSEGNVVAENYVGMLNALKWADLSGMNLLNAIYEFGGKGETPLLPAITRTINLGVLNVPAVPTLTTGSDTGSSSTDKITSDNTPTISVSSLIVGATITLTATPASGTPVTCTFVATATTDSCTFATLLDGTYSISATQGFGSFTTTSSTALTSVQIDATGPSVTLTSSIANNGSTTLTTAITITATFSESVTGFLLGEITRAASSTGWTLGTTLSGSGTTYTFTATNGTGVANTAGALILSIAQGVAQDTAGNGNSASANYRINWVATLSFNANSGTGTAPTSIVQSTAGASITLPGANTLARTGFTFAGWNTQADGLGTLYAVGDPFTPSANTTLFAYWKVLITYDPNGGSGSGPTPTEVVGGSATISGAGTLSRSGFSFAGWNTQADGQGIAISPSSSYSASVSVTIYAQWTSTITYDGNTNTSGSVPSPTTAQSSTATTSLATNSGNLQKTNYTFGGWNTLANGLGTNYPSPTPAVITEVPYMHFFADNFNDTTNAWTNNGDAARSIPGTAVSSSAGFIRGNPTLTTNYSGSNGSNKTFRAVKGSTADGILIGNQALSNYTFCHVARYAGATRGRIFAGLSGNWLSGFWSNNSEVAFHNDWITSSTGTNDTNWRVICDTGGATSGLSSLRSNGISKTTVTTNTVPLPANLSINLFGSRTGPVELSDWEVAEFYLFDSVLSAEKILQLEAVLNHKYGLTAMTSSLDTFNYASTGDVTLYAQWNCTITYSANGATSGTVPAATPCVGSNPVTLRSNSGTLARTGYTFIGWNTAVDGTGTSYSQSANYTPAGNITLYAQWGSTITYNGNGATAGTAPASTTITTTSALKLATNSGALTKTGLIFAGWNRKADGTGTSYASAGTYSPAGNVTLYALWLSACTSTRTILSGFVIETFSNAGTCYWTIPATATTFDYLLVGGGGGGGSSLGGGGGGGQVIYRTGVQGSDIAVITIGAGGAGGIGSFGDTTNHGKKGGNSAFASNNVSDIALGGSGGNGRVSATNLNPDGTAISTGFTGGGGAYANPPAEIAITPLGGAGFIGGNGSGNGGGGGGGAGGPGVARSAASNASSGGIGVSNSINGTATYYGGGGGAAWYGSKTSWTGLGGLGGGGNGVDNALGNTAGGNGQANRGGGGGGAYDGVSGGNGGSGFVVVRYEVGRASAPTITSITPSSGQLSITFTPPTTDGGAAISNYQYSLDGGITWLTPSPAVTTSPLILTGLANGTTFPVVIRAFNGLSGVASNEVSATTPLSAPTISAAAGNTDVTITLTPGSGATPTSYTVTALNNLGVPLAPAKSCVVTYPATACTISGLTNGSDYRFSAVAIKGSLTSAVSNLTPAIRPTAYTVTYIYGNGSANTTALFTRGSNFTLPATPVRSGYTFTGWFAAATGGSSLGAGGASYLPGGSETLYAQWSGNTYAISYNGNGNSGGTLPANGSFTTGGSAHTISAAAGFSKSGHTLTGWNTQADGLGVDYGAGTANTTYSGIGDLSLFAKWALTSYTVSYALNGGTSASGAPTESAKTLGQSFTLASATGITNVGFSFGGWSDGSVTYRAGDLYVMGATNTTLTAQWVKIFIVTFDSNGSTAGSAPSSSSYLTNAPGMVLPSVGSMTKTGYTFDGWSETPTGALVNSSAYTTTRDITLYAKWSLAQITPIFTAGILGSTPATITLPTNQSTQFGALYALPDLSAGEKNPTIGSPQAFYEFVGWSDGATTYRAGDTYRVGATIPTFTAQWVEVYTVSYSLNGGTSTRPVDVKYPKGTPITTATTPSRDGYTFLRWIDQSGVTVNAGAPYTVDDGHYLLYAQWQANSYSINFADSTTDPTVASLPAQQSGSYGQILTLSATEPTRAGYTFLRWTINQDGTGLRYGAGAQLQVGLSHISLYAQWSAATLTIVYSGTITSGALPGQQGALNGANVTLPNNSGAPTSFARSGYTFTGWSDGTSLFAPAAAFTMPAVNTLLTAQWALNAPNTPEAPTVVAGNSSATVTVNPGSGNGGAAASYTIEASPGSGFCIVYSPATSCTISPLDNGTSYTFTTIATNSSGDSAVGTSVSATPSTKPDAVTGVVASAGEGRATITFNAPVNNGGAPITSYLVTSSPGGQTCTVNSPFIAPLACTVNSLTNGTAYTFTVVASNSNYASTPSVPSAPVVPITYPDAPTVSASSTTPGSATVLITAPASNGGSAITSYTVTSAPGGFTCLVLAPNTSCAFDGVLTNGVSYTFTATAINGKGSSPASTPSNVVLPQSRPDAPTNVYATPGDEGATVHFTAPNANGSAITNYVATALDVNGVPLSPAVTCTAIAPATSCEITAGLTNGTRYKFSVVATNGIGTSSPGITAATTTPQDRVAPILIYNSYPSGTTSLNQTLSAEQIFDGIPLPTVSYEWKRCTTDNDPATCVTIPGENLASYVISNADVGFFIRVASTATNSVLPNLTTLSPATEEITGTPQAPTINTGLTANIGESYSLATVAFGGAAPLTYAITSGALPAGLTLDSLTGNITGTPTTSGIFAITVSVVDQKGATSSQTFSITVVDPNANNQNNNQNNAAPTPPQNPGSSDAAEAAAAKAAADAAAKAAADAAAKEKAAADAAAAEASRAAAKLIADRAAAEAAAKLAAEKKAAADQAQADAIAAAQAAAQRALAADAARKAAADSAARAAALLRSNLVSAAAKRSAAAQAAAAEAKASAAVKSAAQAASVASSANANALAASKEVVISVGALNSAQSAAEKSAALDAQAAAARSAAKATADAAVAQAQLERDRAAAATKAAADALAAAAEKQRAAAQAAAAAQAESDRLAQVAVERATAKADAEKAATLVASLLSEQAKLSEVLANSNDPDEIAKTQDALEVLSEKLDVAQENLDSAVEDVEAAVKLETTVAENLNRAINRAESANRSAVKAKNEATKARTSAAKVVASALVAEKAANSASNAVKEIVATKLKTLAPKTVPVNAKQSDAVISVGGLKPGQKIRVIVKVNIK